MAYIAGFNAADHEPHSGFDPIPSGKYLCAITGSEMKMTKHGDARYLELELQVLDGPFRNRRLWDRLNIENPSERAQSIALGTLSAICRAVGVMAPRDSIELHDRPLLVSVGQERRSDSTEHQNVIRSYAPAPGSDRAPGTGSPSPEAPSGGGPGGEADASTPPYARPDAAEAIDDDDKIPF